MKKILTITPQEKTRWQRFLSVFRSTTQKVEPLQNMAEVDSSMPEVTIKVLEDPIPSTLEKRGNLGILRSFSNKITTKAEELNNRTFGRLINYFGEKLGKENAGRISKIARILRISIAYTTASVAIGLGATNGIEALASNPQWASIFTNVLIAVNSVAIVGGVISENKKESQYRERISRIILALNDEAQNEYRLPRARDFFEQFDHNKPGLNSFIAVSSHTINSAVGSIATTLKAVVGNSPNPQDFPIIASLFAISRASSFISANGKILTYKNKFDVQKLIMATVATNYIYCVQQKDPKKHDQICQIMKSIIGDLSLSEENQYNEWAKFYIYKALNELPKETIQNKELCKTAIKELLSNVLVDEKTGFRGRVSTGKRIISKEAFKKIDSANQFSFSPSDLKSSKDLAMSDAFEIFSEKIKETILERSDPLLYDRAKKVSDNVISNLNLRTSSNSASFALPKVITQICFGFYHDEDLKKHATQQQYSQEKADEELVKLITETYSPIVSNSEVVMSEIGRYFLQSKFNHQNSRFGYEHLRIFGKREFLSKVSPLLTAESEVENLSEVASSSITTPSNTPSSQSRETQNLLDRSSTSTAAEPLLTTASDSTENSSEAASFSMTTPLTTPRSQSNETQQGPSNSPTSTSKHANFRQDSQTLNR